MNQRTQDLGAWRTVLPWPRASVHLTYTPFPDRTVTDSIRGTRAVNSALVPPNRKDSINYPLRQVIMPPKASPTHFVCIPLAGTQLARSLASFRADVTSPLSFAVPEDAVRPLGTLHLTLGVMSLKEQGVGRAADVLRSLRLRELLATARVSASSTSSHPGGESTSPAEDGRLAVTLRGLEPMQAATKTSVLYAAPSDAEGILYRFCEQIKAAFVEAGLMADENRPLLLHATIVNTIYAKGGQRGQRRERMTIDAREILSRYEDYVWMENMAVDKVTLCRMGAKKVEGTDDAAYEVEAEVQV